MKIAIIGHGFVGKAVDFGFTHNDLEKIIIDPKDGTDIDDLKYMDLDAAFICVPTPMSNDGSINGSIVTDVVDFLKKNTNTLAIIVKSTITPDIIDELQQDDHGDLVVYNPEFLTERNYANDFIHPDFHILGGDREKCEYVLNLYTKYSRCNTCPVHYMSGKEASFVKYGINSYLASKVLWFNQFYDIVNENDCNYNIILKAITNDNRITESHTQVPGHDNKRGFGGACFPKDTAAFLNFNKSFTILREIITVNNAMRSTYKKDFRESEQNIHYGDK